MNIQTDWTKRASTVLPAGSLGNFDLGVTINRGKGARIWDEDDREFVDYLIGSGPMILGHGNEEVIDAVRSQLDTGFTFFTNNAKAIELAEEITKAMNCAEQVRFVSTGSEADMYAMRLARAFTGREKILKFEGGYHGMCSEAQMSLAPTRLVNFPTAVPDSAGIPASVQESMVISQFNDLELTESLMNEYGEEVAAIIVEPLQRIIPPIPGFLEGLRKLCDKHNALLIFDEIVTGFRFAYGGAQELYGVTPDVCTLGKIIGGGFPLAAIAGRADIMAKFDKAKANDGFLMQVGTLSGNPVAAVAGLKTLEILRRENQYVKLREIGTKLMKVFSEPFANAGVEHRIVGEPELFDVVFTNGDVSNYRHTKAVDTDKTGRFPILLREYGILKPPGKCYPCLALTEEDFDITTNAIEQVIGKLMQN